MAGTSHYVIVISIHIHPSSANLEDILFLNTLCLNSNFNSSQIATTYITPELSGERLTPKLHTAVSEAFVKRFGKYAGWAQNVLFIAELSSHQLLLPEHLRTKREKKVNGKSRKRSKVDES